MGFIKDDGIAFRQNGMRVNDFNRQERVICYHDIGSLGFSFCVDRKTFATKSTFVGTNAFTT